MKRGKMKSERITNKEEEIWVPNMASYYFTSVSSFGSAISMTSFYQGNIGIGIVGGILGIGFGMLAYSSGYIIEN